MGEKYTSKVFILLLVCVVLVLGGCSSNGSQDQVQDCSVSQINKMIEYYNQQREKMFYILDEVGPDDASGAYRQSSELFAEVSDYDHLACATAAHSHFVNALDKMTEAYRLQWDAESAKATGDIVTATEKINATTEAIKSAEAEFVKFREEIEKLKQ